jgi:hypothetical protein
MSQSSIGPERFTAVPQIPTLYAKRSEWDTSIPRKKSSKRKAEDNARERELRAMTAPIPIPKPRRPATYSGSGPLQRETKRIPGDLGRPSSQVSLPIAENIYEPDEDPYQNSFKIGILAALSPRPTVKYNGRSQSSLAKQPSRLPPLQQSIEEEDLSQSRRRIDDLADDLDSAGLRELMERDRKRRERKKQGDKANLQRKLQRRAEKQREEETRRNRTEEFARSSSAEIHAQGPQPSLPPDINGSRNLADPFADPAAAEKTTQTPIRNPFEDEKDVEADIMSDVYDEHDAAETPITIPSPEKQAKPVPQANNMAAPQGAVSPPMSPMQSLVDERNMSQTSFKKEKISPEAAAGLERQRQSSDHGVQQSSWTSFFRRGTRHKGSAPDRGRFTPSEFSNTSRESFARKGPPPQLMASQRTFRQSGSATPQRTMSKFREDLPEYPMSPPDSRMQSPETTETRPINTATSGGRHLVHSQSGTLDGRSLATSSSIPTLDRGRPDSRVHSLMSGDSEAAGHALSQSLASVDSEGSWLSGKPVKRFSGPLSPMLSDKEKQKPDEMEEDIASDDYLSRLSPEPDARRQSTISGRRASSALMDFHADQQSPIPPVPPIARGADQGELWHDSVRRQPTVIKQASRAKSQEGLLKNFESADVENASDEETESPRSEEDMTIMRARSVDYGKGHARKISASSGKLLDIRRGSVHSVSTPPRSPALRSTNALAGQEAPKEET